MHSTISVALSLLERLHLSDRLIRDGVPLPTLDRIADISALSVTNSLKYVREELRNCISTSIALLSAIERVQLDASGLFRRCTHPDTTACAQAFELVRNKQILGAVVEDMSFLGKTLDDEVDGLAHARGSHPSIMTLLPAIQVHGAVLDALLLFAQNARHAAAATVRAGRFASISKDNLS